MSYLSGFEQQECQSTGKHVNVSPLKGANSTDTKVDPLQSEDDDCFYGKIRSASLSAAHTTLNR